MARLPSLISVRQAADAKGCTTQAIYQALDRGDLDDVRIDRARHVRANKRYREWQVKETGGRTHRKRVTDA